VSFSLGIEAGSLLYLNIIGKKKDSTVKTSIILAAPYQASLLEDFLRDITRYGWVENYAALQSVVACGDSSRMGNLIFLNSVVLSTSCFDSLSICILGYIRSQG